MASGKRHTIDSVKLFFGEFGWTVRSTEYINANSQLDCICPAGHPHQRSLESFRASKKCGECIKIEKSRATIQMIAETLQKIDWKLESTEYEGPHKKLKMKCPDPNHPVLDLSWSDFKHEGVRCKYCLKANPVSERSEEEQRSIKIVNRMRADLSYFIDNLYPKRPRKKIPFLRQLALDIVATIGPRPTDSAGDRSLQFTLDHRVTCSWFNHNKEEQVQLCWNVNNMAWVRSGENSIKSNYLTRSQMLELNPYQIAIANLAEWRPVDEEKMMRQLGLWMSKEEAWMMIKTLEIDRMSA